jgi:hypothetical protein
MGKKKRIKALRKIAETLTPLGVELNDGSLHRINHARRLKKLHEKHGMNGVVKYCEAVENHVKHVQANEA